MSVTLHLDALTADDREAVIDLLRGLRDDARRAISAASETADLDPLVERWVTLNSVIRSAGTRPRARRES